MDNRPKGREKHVTGQGKDIYKRGEGLGSGPVGSTGGHSGQNGQGTGGSTNRAGSTATRGKGSLIGIILAAVVLLGGGGAGLSGLFSGGTQSAAPAGGYTGSGSTAASSSSSSSAASSQGLDLSGLFGGFGNTSSGWSNTANTGKLNTSVAAGARDKRTEILGRGQDTVTLMVYMCGTDLESKYGMGTADLQEMAAATLSDKVNVIVYTGGCKQWKTSSISSSVNQIYKVESGALRLLEQDMGNAAMTNPSTLTGFIQYCAKNYPANRNMLIFWDHGGGSLSGYGYDEKNAAAGSMGLSGINTALKDAGETFDFIGFDACLMATLENALMLTEYADYLIASEETEPGVGWYYTNWLTKLSENTSMSTLEIGKNIVDDFVSVCDQKCRGQKTTLSVVDLAELETAAPEKLKSFAAGTSALLQGSEYKTVSTARSGAREFASSNKIDQVDLIHLAYNLDTKESRALAETLLSAVKYNKTSSSMTDAYGLSIYFPYQRTSQVSNAVAAYDAIGMDSEYARCIEQFAALGSAGQAVSSNASSLAGNPLAALLGGGSSSGGTASADMIASLLTSLMSSATGRSLADFDLDSTVTYLSENQFDSSQLVWTGEEPRITLSEEQWGLVSELELNVFFDDGEGYIDLGLDNVFDFSDDGALLGDFDGTWLAIDGQSVAYYHTGTVYDGDNYTITGYVPCLVNGAQAELLLVFDSENPYGYIAGYRDVYDEELTETVAKSAGELAEGDVINFTCDYYGYDGSYQDSYMLGEPWQYHDGAEISNVTIDASAARATYCFTDIYGQRYWTPPIP